MKKEVIVSLIYAVLGFFMPLLNVVLNHESAWAGFAYAAVAGIFLGVGDLLFARHDWKCSGIDALCCFCGGLVGALLFTIF